ncbi:MAG: Lrp/AsnC family transcriptional regulator [Nanoarchaeales archaeon]|nr:Lrp/AsnC family transcriptional regulator [Nanoarchaeales archaeon]
MVKFGQITSKSNIKLDSKDKAILMCLNENCRMSLADISRKTRIPLDTIRYRLAKMEKEEIFSYGIITNPQKIGFPLYTAIYLNLVNFTQDREDELRKYIVENKYIIYGGKTLGKYDFIVGFASKDLEDLNEELQKFKSEFQTIIKEFDVLNVLEEFKYDYAVELIGE